jgi:hypothetical protein
METTVLTQNLITQNLKELKKEKTGGVIKLVKKKPISLAKGKNEKILL